MEIKVKNNKKMKGYITLVVVILFVPFLLLQGINLVNTSIDTIYISSSTVSSNNKYINDQTCWEEVLFYIKNNGDSFGSKILNTPDITCEFSLQEIGDNKLEIVLETTKDNYYSKTTRYITYGKDSIAFIPSP